ncbi:PPOX class F420-dependent oxidoreductase [Actinomadura adrarensis]|uniref:PPOX class F420-dependent oxidoreductase n=1 Tax=Actinomadura adrarensis TaxID=1819600 RepID=A0ABW3CSA8_9ACTN
MDFTDNEREYLSTQRLARLATIAPDGSPQNNPVGFHLNETLGTIDIYGHNLPASRKFRNVQQNPRVALVIDDLKSVDPWHVRGLEIRGRAEAVTANRPLIRIHPQTVFTWGLEPSQGMTKRTAA